MIKKILPAIMLAFLGFMLNCSQGLETGSFSPVSLMTISDFGPHMTEPMPPEVAAVTPADLSTGISTMTTIQARFSEAMNPPTLNTATFAVVTSMGPVSGDVIYSVSTRTATFTPTAPLDAIEFYYVTISSSVTDLSGTPMTADYSWSFQTTMGGTLGAPWFDPIPPYNNVGPLSVTLDAGDPMASILFTINDIDPDPDSLPMYGEIYTPGIPIDLPGTYAPATGGTYTIRAIAYRSGYTSSAIATGVYTLQAPRPAISLASGTYGPGTTITVNATTGYYIDVTVTTGIGSGTVYDITPPNYTISLNQNMTVSAVAHIDGMEYSDPVTATYTYDNVAPQVLSTFPVDDGTERYVRYDSPIRVTFSKEMNPTTITTNNGSTVCSGNIMLMADDGSCPPLNLEPVPTVDNRTWHMYVSAPYLTTGMHYEIMVSTGARDIYGNALATNYVSPSGFTTDIVGLLDSDTFNQASTTPGYYYINNTMTTQGRALALRSDGYIYVAGINGGVLPTDFAVWRFRPNGTMDAVTFVSPGFSGAGSHEAYDIALTPTNVVIAGFCAGTNNDFGLAGYLDTGALDGSFGRSITPGRYELDWGFLSAEQAYGMALDSMERIVIVGYTTETVFGTKDFAIARFAAGAKMLDNTFSSDGQDNQEMATGLNEVATAVAIDQGVDAGAVADDRIVAVGWHDTTGSLQKIVAIIIYDNNGNVIRRFLDTISVISEANAVLIQPDHRILVAGRAYTGTDNDMMVVQYNSDGSHDTGFGNLGARLINLIPGSNEYATSIALQKDGKIIVVGTSDGFGHASDIAVVRLNPDGSRDTSFGNNDLDGVADTAVFTISSNNEYSTDVVIQPDNRIVVTGTHNGGSNDDMLLLRFR